MLKIADSHKSFTVDISKKKRHSTNSLGIQHTRSQTWLRGLSGDFFHSFHIMSLYWCSVRPGFSSFSLGSSASSNACHKIITNAIEAPNIYQTVEELTTEAHKNYTSIKNMIMQNRNLLCWKWIQKTVTVSSLDELYTTSIFFMYR